MCHAVPWLGSAETIDGEVLGCDRPDVRSLEGPGTNAHGLVPVDEISRVRGYACVAFTSVAGDGD